MVPKQNSIKVSQIPRDLLPEGVSIARLPLVPAEAISFELVPLEPEPKPEPVITPSAPPSIPTLSPRVQQQLVIEKVIKEEVEEVTIFQGVPEQYGEGTYLGVVWATSQAEAEKVADLKYKIDDQEFLVDLAQKGPRPYFVIQKPAITPMLSAIAPIPGKHSPLTIPEAQLNPPNVQTCTNCLAAINIDADITEWRCPVCKTINRII